MANEKSDSHAARKNLPKLAGFIIGVALLIALAYIYHLNGYSETPQVKATSTSRVSETASPTLAPTIVSTTSTDTPTPAEIEKAKQDEVLSIMASQESRWVEMGYSPSGVLTDRTIEINGQQVKSKCIRYGTAMICTDQNFVDRSLDYYGNDGGVPEKTIGEVIIPNKKIQDWEYKAATLGLIIHSENNGFHKDVLGYLQSISGNVNANYTIQEYVRRAGAYRLADMPPINPNLPVTFFIGNPTLTREMVNKGIKGGDPRIPFNLPYSSTGGFSGIYVDKNGAMTIAFTEILTSEGLMNVDYYTDPAQMVLNMIQVGITQSSRSPVSSGSVSKELNYIRDEIIGPDQYSPLLTWGKN